LVIDPLTTGTSRVKSTPAEPSPMVRVRIEPPRSSVAGFMFEDEAMTAAAPFSGLNVTLPLTRNLAGVVPAVRVIVSRVNAPPERVNVRPASTSRVWTEKEPPLIETAWENWAEIGVESADGTYPTVSEPPVRLRGCWT
jgi:hypothetical protein